MANGQTDHIRFERILLAAGIKFERQEPNYEGVIVILSGSCVFEAEDVCTVLKRSSVFTEPAMAVYTPAGAAFTVQATVETELALCLGQASPGGRVTVIGADDLFCRSIGRDTYERTVCDVVGLNVSARHLVVGETFNAPGGWSSYPPHRHDEDRLPEEANMEEVYFFRVDPPVGFGMQRLYSPDAGFDRAVVIRDGEVVAIPEGFHPVCAAPGCSLYYLWILWGEQRVLAPFDDPAFGPVKERL